MNKLLCLIKHRFEIFGLGSTRVRICARCGQAERAVYFTNAQGVTTERWVERVTLTWEKIR